MTEMLKQVQHDAPRLLAAFIKNVTLREAISMEELVSGSNLKSVIDNAEREVCLQPI